MKVTYDVKKRYIGECDMVALWIRDPKTGEESIITVEESVDVNTPFSLNEDFFPHDVDGGVSARFPATSRGWRRAMSFVDEVV